MVTFRSDTQWQPEDLTCCPPDVKAIAIFHNLDPSIGKLVCGLNDHFPVVNVPKLGPSNWYAGMSPSHHSPAVKVPKLSVMDIQTSLGLS